MIDAMSPEEQLINDIGMFTHDPLSYALYAFPWGKLVPNLKMLVGLVNGRLTH